MDGVRVKKLDINIAEDCSAVYSVDGKQFAAKATTIEIKSKRQPSGGIITTVDITLQVGNQFAPLVGKKRPREMLDRDGDPVEYDNYPDLSYNPDGTEKMTFKDEITIFKEELEKI